MIWKLTMSIELNSRFFCCETEIIVDGICMPTTLLNQGCSWDCYDDNPSLSKEESKGGSQGRHQSLQQVLLRNEFRRKRVKNNDCKRKFLACSATMRAARPISSNTGHPASANPEARPARGRSSSGRFDPFCAAEELICRLQIGKAISV